MVANSVKNINETLMPLFENPFDSSRLKDFEIKSNFSICETYDFLCAIRHLEGSLSFLLRSYERVIPEKANA